MTKVEWGTKRQCPKCATRFYDLQNDDPVTCISCGHSWVPEPILKSKQALSFKEDKADSKTDAADTEDDDIDLEDADDDEPSPDTEVDIGTDEDDLSDVVVQKRSNEDGEV